MLESCSLECQRVGKKLSKISKVATWISWFFYTNVNYNLHFSFLGVLYNNYKHRFTRIAWNLALKSCSQIWTKFNGTKHMVHLMTCRTLSSGRLCVQTSKRWWHSRNSHELKFSMKYWHFRAWYVLSTYILHKREANLLDKFEEPQKVAPNAESC